VQEFYPVGEGVIYDKAKVLSNVLLETEGEDWHIGDFCLVTVPRLKIGKGSHINAHSSILGRECVEIGRDSVISYYCLLLTSSDSPDPPDRKHNDYSPETLRAVKSNPIYIGNDCFIGAHVTLMPGCIVPDNTVIKAYSYCYMKYGRLEMR